MPNKWKVYSALPISRGHFSPKNSWKTPMARLLGRGMGVFGEFEIWPKFYLRSCYTSCNIVLYCTAIYWESIVPGLPIIWCSADWKGCIFPLLIICHYSRWPQETPQHYGWVRIWYNHACIQTVAYFHDRKPFLKKKTDIHLVTHVCLFSDVYVEYWQVIECNSNGLSPNWHPTAIKRNVDQHRHVDPTFIRILFIIIASAETLVPDNI